MPSVLFTRSVQDMDVKFDVATRHKAYFGCLQVAHARDFLFVIPNDGIGRHMSSIECRTILRYCLITLLFSSNKVFHIYRKVCLDTFEEHVIHCMELLGFK